MLALLFWGRLLLGAAIFYQISPAEPTPEETLSIGIWPRDPGVTGVTLTGPDGTTVDMTLMPDQHYIARVPVGKLAPGRYPVLVTLRNRTLLQQTHAFSVEIFPWTQEKEDLQQRIQDILGKIDLLLAQKVTMVSQQTPAPRSPIQESLVQNIVSAYQAQAEAAQTFQKRRSESPLIAEPVLLPVTETVALARLQDYHDTLVSELAWLEMFQDFPSTALPEIERWRLYAMDRGHGRQDFAALWPTGNEKSRLSPDISEAGIQALRLALQREDIRMDIQRLSLRHQSEHQHYQDLLTEKATLNETLNTLTEALKKKISQYYPETQPHSPTP